MSKIRIGQTPETKSVQIDLAILAETHAFLNASSGAGKSSFMRMLAERIAKHAQIIVIDWEGEYGTLREKLDLLIVGNGDGADLAVDTRTAKLLARRLLETKVSAVIDLSEMDDADKNLYVAYFFQAMLNAPRALWHTLFVFVDELQEIAPAPSSGGGARKADDPISLSLTEFKRMQGRGRKRGFGLICATQSITYVHKDAIRNLKNQFTGQTVLDLDIDRAARNLGFGTDRRLSLRDDLERGDWFAFGPALTERGVVRFHADLGETTHLGAGQKHTLTIPAPTAAIRKSLSQFEDLPGEVQRGEDELAGAQRQVIELKRQISEKERELRQRPTVQTPQTAPTVKIEYVDRPVLNGEVKDFLGGVAELRELFAPLLRFPEAILPLTKSLTAIENKIEVVRAWQAAPARSEFVRPVSPNREQYQTRPAPPRVPQPERPTARVSVLSDTAEGEIGKGERIILTAAAQYPSGVTREQLTILTGYKRSSRDTYLQRLSARGLVAARGAMIVATDDGFAALGDFEPLPTGSALQEYWMNRLTGGEKEILRAAIGVYPDALERVALEEMTGYKRSSRDTYIQRLQARRLVTAERGAIRASDELFD